MTFKLYLIKEFQRLKDEEQRQLGWDIKRNLAKINYRIHTDAIKERLIPATLTPAHAGMVYASEADLLNVALFGMTASEWRRDNPGKDGNIRDHATAAQLVCPPIWRISTPCSSVRDCRKASAWPA